MLAKIAAHTEAHRPALRPDDWKAALGRRPPAATTEAIAALVENALATVPCAAVFVPTRSGATARMISRFNPPVWVVAASRDEAVCRGLAFSYGVHPVVVDADPEDWRDFAGAWLRAHPQPGAMAMLVAGPSERHPAARHRIEFMRVGEG